MKLQTEIPDRLYNEALLLIHEGWFHDQDQILSEALRRFIDSHRIGLMEQFIRDDVEWGLHGDD